MSRAAAILAGSSSARATPSGRTTSERHSAARRKDRTKLVMRPRVALPHARRNVLPSSNAAQSMSSGLVGPPAAGFLLPVAGGALFGSVAGFFAPAVVGGGETEAPG